MGTTISTFGVFQIRQTIEMYHNHTKTHVQNPSHVCDILRAATWKAAVHGHNVVLLNAHSFFNFIVQRQNGVKLGLQKFGTSIELVAGSYARLEWFGFTKRLPFGVCRPLHKLNQWHTFQTKSHLRVAKSDWPQHEPKWRCSLLYVGLKRVGRRKTKLRSVRALRKLIAEKIHPRAHFAHFWVVCVKAHSAIVVNLLKRKLRWPQ